MHRCSEMGRVEVLISDDKEKSRMCVQMESCNCVILSTLKIRPWQKEVDKPQHIWGHCIDKQIN